MRRAATLCSFSTSPHPRKTRRKIIQPKNDRHGDSPSEYIIRNILNYSKALSMIKTQEAGTMNMVMN